MVFTLVASALAGCGSSKETAGDASSAPKAPQEMKINFSADPPALDVSKTTANAAFTILSAISEGLVRMGKDGKATPGLAKELPKVSADGMVYTITLRDGLTWSDGSPLTAKDFVYSYQRTLNAETKGQYSFLLENWIKGAKELKAAKPEEFEAKKAGLGVVAKDDKTLEITLVKPVGFFTEMLAFPTFFPQKEENVKQHGAKYGADFDKVVGAGPFLLQSWDHEQKLVLVKNPKYWDAANVKLEKATVNIVKDRATGVNLFETKESDLTELAAEYVKMFEGKPEYTLKKELTNAYVMFEVKKVPALGNKKIRQALAMSIDRNAFVNTVLKNGSVGSTGFVPGGTLDGNGNEFRKTAGDTQPKFDAAKAKELLAEGLKELNLTAMPKFKLTADDTEGAKKSLEFVLAQWKQNLGVEAIGEPIPHALRIEKQHNKDYEAVFALWGADYNDPMTFLDMWITNGEFNETDWSNKAYDDLIAAADKNANKEQRAKQLVDAEKILMDEMPIAPIYFRSKVFAKRANVDGLVLPSYGQEWELKWVTIK
jgi:oligopeptide transport system substrate-binding protein